MVLCSNIGMLLKYVKIDPSHNLLGKKINFWKPLLVHYYIFWNVFNRSSEEAAYNFHNETYFQLLFFILYLSSVKINKR